MSALADQGGESVKKNEINKKFVVCSSHPLVNSHFHCGAQNQLSDVLMFISKIYIDVICCFD